LPGSKARLPLWILAGVFLIEAAAWGMTLRPEPFVALLAGISLAAMFSFSAEPRVGPLVTASVAVVLAINAHPAGGTVAAPVLACAPAIFRWLRRDRRVVVASACLVGAAAALAVLLFALGSDVSNRLADAELVRSGSLHAEPWWREYVRYESVILDGGNQVRRTSLVLFGVALLLFATRGRGATARFSSLAGRTLCVSTVLLLATPSKWLWHFGALTIFLAVAAAVEGARLAEAEQRPSWVGRPIVTFGLFAGFGLWAWGARSGWAALDLMVARWNYGFSLLSWLIAVPGGLAAVAFLRRRRGLSTRPTGALTSWGIAVFSLLVVWITLGVFAGDARFAEWSPGRPYASALVGRSGCGVADTIRVGPDRAPLSPLIQKPHVTLMDPFISPYFPCAEQPGIDHGVVATPDHLVAQGTPWPVQVRDGAFEAFFDLYPIRQIVGTKRGVRVWRIDPRIDGYERVEPSRVKST
jgi:arabinosyltransferase B/arabinosyltransferase C